MWVCLRRALNVAEERNGIYTTGPVFNHAKNFLFILIILLYILTDLTFTFVKPEAFLETVVFPVLSVNSPGEWDFPPICDFRR